MRNATSHATPVNISSLYQTLSVIIIMIIIIIIIIIIMMMMMMIIHDNKSRATSSEDV